MVFSCRKDDVSNKSTVFASLLHSVDFCDICPRMCGRNKVLSEMNGSLNTKVMFIAEAPGRLGAECTKIPLYGDRTGDNFEMLINNAGWKRENVFITNAILCNPQDENGNNSTPTKDEIVNCSAYLRMTIDLVNPAVIVTLGIKALDALKNITAHKYVLKENVAQCLDWNGRKLYPLYHMGPRALIHRNMSKQCGDFIKLSHIVDPQDGLKNICTMPEKPIAVPLDNTVNKRIADTLMYIINIEAAVSMFKATKLMYLADLYALEKTGSTITQSIYLRMQEGPWIPNLKNVAEQLKKHHAIRIEFRSRKPYYAACQKDYHFDSLCDEQIAILDEILLKYKGCDDAKIKTLAYLTEPMKYVRRQEKAGRSMTKIPVLYQNKTVIDIDIPKDKTQ